MSLRGLNMDALAAQAGVSRRTINRMAAGRRVRQDSIERVFRVFQEVPARAELASLLEEVV